MIPRLTKRGLHNEACYQLNSRAGIKIRFGASRPSPAEKRKARHLSMATAKRAMSHREDVDLTLAYMVGRGDRDWPASRGTTSQQFVSMHLLAEEESARGGKRYGGE